MLDPTFGAGARAPRIASPDREESLIDSIYDAIAEPTLWDAVLTAIADAAGSSSAIWVGHCEDSFSTPRFAHFGRLDREFNLRVAREDFGASPLMPALAALGTGEIACAEAVLPPDTARRSLWYREIMAPQNIEHCLMSVLARGAGIFAPFFLVRGRSAGAFGGGEIAVLGQLLPHLARATRMRRRDGAYVALSRNHERLLDSLATGVILIDENGAARCANRAAEEIVAAADGLRMRGTSLSTAEPSAGTRLHNLIAETAAGAPGSSLAIPRGEEREPLLVCVCPLRGGIRDRLGGGKTRQAVGLFITDPEERRGGLDGVLAQHYKLTPAETRVASTLAAGIGVGNAASRLGLSENTVKMHAKRTFEKLGIDSQAKLARLFGRLATPVRNEVMAA